MQSIANALEKTAHIGTRDCADFRKQIFTRHKFLANVLANGYASEARNHGLKSANTWLRQTSAGLLLVKPAIYADCDDQVIKDIAELKAKDFEERVSIAVANGAAQALLDEAESFCNDCGVQFPYKPRKSDTKEQLNKKRVGALARLCKAKWWRLQLRKEAYRRCEKVLRECGVVSSKRGVYVSDFTMIRRLEQKSRNANLLENMIAENDAGYMASLAEIASKGVSNPEMRRNELMTRISGFETIAKALGYRGVFLTLTCPSKYHAVNKSGFRNTHFDGYTPKQGQDYLCGVWSRIRSAWDKKGIKPFGFRVAEPHTDGTPHWHILLFVEEEKAFPLIKIARDHAIKEDKHELKNGLSGRFHFTNIDASKGSASGYIAKYISKNIDGHGSFIDLEAGDWADVTAARVDAWAACWGIRQFQQIGGASVTVWRELRKAVSIGAIDLEHVTEEKLLEITEAANEGDWAAFVNAMGGVLVPRSDHWIKAYQVMTGLENDYGEEIERFKGVLMRTGKKVVTRIYEWTIKRAARPQGEAAQQAP